jgi:probable rRNA maturation factor
MISFTNETKKHISYEEYRKLYKYIFNKKQREKWDISVVFAKAGRMRKLNKLYRKKDKLANVLSFEIEKGEVGEIFLHAGEKDLKFLFIHGCLHLLGYTHNNKRNIELMEKKEQMALKHIKN